MMLRHYGLFLENGKGESESSPSFDPNAPLDQVGKIKIDKSVPRYDESLKSKKDLDPLNLLDTYKPIDISKNNWE